MGGTDYDTEGTQAEWKGMRPRKKGRRERESKECRLPSTGAGWAIVDKREVRHMTF